MMRCTTSLLLAFMVAAAAQTAVAQVPCVEMTLADALSRAEASPDLLIARAAQAVAERSIAVVQKPQSRPPRTPSRLASGYRSPCRSDGAASGLRLSMWCAPSETRLRRQQALRRIERARK
jgi:hypothetical protein